VGIVIAGDSLVAPLPEDGATGSGTLFSITFTIVANGVSPIHFDLSSLVTVISGTSVDIEHTPVSGLFDNRIANTLPVPQFTGPLTGVEGQSYTFTSTSYDPDGWIVSEEWDFGDGENATGPVVSHAFAAGTYTVTLTVTDGPDGETATATASIDIQIWMEGGWVPDLIGWYAKPEHPDLNEAYGDRLLNLTAKIGNPESVEEDYEVYAEFKLYSKDEVALLGNLNSPVETLAPGEQVTVKALFDTANPQWRCFSGGEWVVYGYVHYFMHKYVGFASCYYRLVGETEWTEAYVSKYISFHVKSVRHDIGIIDMWANVTKPNQGDPVLISVNVTTEGAMQETFNIAITYKDVTIDEIPVTLDPGEFQVKTTTWDTTGVPLGAYVVNAELPLLAYERDATDQSDYVVIRVQ
jgi:PKD repeat protein